MMKTVYPARDNNVLQGFSLSPTQQALSPPPVVLPADGAPSQWVLGVTPVERQIASCQQVAGIILRLHRSWLA
jgi:hypothetical protein